MPCYSPLKGYVNLENGGIVFKRMKNAGAATDVACGQCLGCRLDKSREWAARIIHEAAMWDDNIFVTLTYDDEHLPRDGSLNKEHFQKFVKRLRKKFKGRVIRYYHCGEYGDELDRPHYHACFFNLDFPDKELFKETDGNFLFYSETLEKLWGNGFCTIGELTFQSSAMRLSFFLQAAFACSFISRKCLTLRSILKLLFVGFARNNPRKRAPWTSIQFPILDVNWWTDTVMS